MFGNNGNPTDSHEWIALSHRNASVAYEAPSQFAISESESIRAFTIVVRPKDHTVYAPAIIGKYAGGYGPRAKRPTGGDQIDWSLPITKDLKLFGSVHEGFPFDYVNRRPGVPQSAWAGVGPSPDGHLGHLGLEADGVTNSILFEKDDEAIGGATEATFMVYTFHSTNVATVNQLVFGYTGTGDDPFYCRMGTTGFQTRIWTDTPNNFTSSVDKSANGLDEAARYLWGSTFENNLLTARVDKIKDSAPTATTGAIVDDGGVNANNLWRFGYGFNGGTGGWDGWATFCAYWRRALTDQEWNMMVDDPWHIFQRKRIYIGQPPKRRVVTF